MCAYLIKDSDKNIEQPIARIAIKRLVSKRKFIFVAEPRIYGDTQFAQELNFANEVNNILNTSNKETAKNELFFTRKDADSYSDGGIDMLLNQNLSSDEIADIILKYPNKNKLDWDEISKIPNLNEDVIRICKDYVNWKYITSYQNLSDEFLNEFKDYISWQTLITTKKLSKNFIIKHWEYLKRQFKIMPSLVDSFIKNNYLNISLDLFDDLVKNNLITPSAMNRWISRNLENITPEFIKKYNNLINWHSLSSTPLSEDFIKRFKDYVDWDEISYYQKLSPEFISEFKDYINFDELNDNSYIYS